MRSFVTALIVMVFAVVQIVPAVGGARADAGSVHEQSMTGAGSVIRAAEAAPDRTMTCCAMSVDQDLTKVSTPCSADCATLLPLPLALRIPASIRRHERHAVTFQDTTPPRAERPPQTV